MKAIWNSKSAGEFDSDFDCYIAEALLSEGRPIGAQEVTLLKYGARTLLELAQQQHKRLEAYPKLVSLFYEIEMPLAGVLWQMEKKGILLDIQKLSSVGKEIEAQLTSVQDEISKETGGVINLNSSLQLGYFLAEKMCVPLGNTRTG